MWSLENNMKVNKGKSGILELTYRRKKLIQNTQILDYPIKKEYEYLGLWLADRVSLKNHIN